MKNSILIGSVLITIIVVGIGVYLLTQSDTVVVENPEGQIIGEPGVIDQTPGDTLQATSTPEINEAETVIGTSAGNRAITAYHYGSGDTELLFVGGIHGGYSWNTALVAYQLMDYLEENPSVIPEEIRVTVIPVLNPDGLSKVVTPQNDGRFARADVSTTESVLVSGRFNDNNVDLNRNFDCDWQSSGVWQNRTVSGGSSVFSEPESQALRAYVEARDIAGAVVWYSAAGGVFASNCHVDILPQTLALTNAYAQASGYRAYESFDFYEITGDMVNWLAKKDIPAISVLLTTHQDVEWDKNRAGVEAVFTYYAQQQ